MCAKKKMLYKIQMKIFVFLKWYFLSKANIWNVNCVRATALIFDTRTGVLVKVSKFLRQKMSRPEGVFIQASVS